MKCRHGPNLSSEIGWEAYKRREGVACETEVILLCMRLRSAEFAFAF